MDWLNNNSMLIAQKGLDFTWQRQRIITENIANAETPGYKSKYVTFEDELRQRLYGASQSKKGNRYDNIRAAAGNARYTVHRTIPETTRLDDNNVNVDVENVELARTQLQYEYLVRQVSDQLTRLRMVIEGR